MKIIKDSICCKKKEIEKQTGENSNVIIAAEVQNNPKAFVSNDAMKIICNLDKFNLGNDIYITGDAKIHGMVIDGGKKYLKFEYPIYYLKYIGKTPQNYLNYDSTEIGIFKVWLNNNGYIFSISNLNAEFLEKCELLLTNKDIKNCSYIDVEEKIFNKQKYYYIRNKSYNMPKLCVKLRVFYKNINAYWNDSTDSCIEFKEMADFSQTDKNAKDDKITNAGFYKKILTDKNIDAPHGFFVHLDDVNQKCVIGNKLGAAMGSFFNVDKENESGKLPRYVITFKQGQQYYKIMFKTFGDNLNFKKT